MNNLTDLPSTVQRMPKRKKDNRKQIRLSFLSHIEHSIFNFLKFLTDNEVEVASTSLIVSITVSYTHLRAHET